MQSWIPEDHHDPTPEERKGAFERYTAEQVRVMGLLGLYKLD